MHVHGFANELMLLNVQQLLQEDIRDLLSKDQSRRLELKERPDTGVYVKVSIHLADNIQ